MRLFFISFLVFHVLAQLPCDIEGAIRRYVATSNAFFSSPTADDRKAFYAQIEKMVHFFSKVKFGGKPIDNEMFVDMYPFVDMQIDLEMVGIDGNFALVTWRERFRYGNQTVLETHETTTAEFDMVECVPKTFDQILDTVREKEVWDTLALAKKQDERVHRFSCNVCKWPFEFAKQVNDFMVNPTPAGAVACARWFSLTTLSETYSPEALLDLAKYVKVWFEIEHSAANGNTATWTWKQFYQFDDEVQLSTHEGIVAHIDLERCLPVSWDQVVDTAEEEKWQAKFREMQERKKVYRRIQHFEL